METLKKSNKEKYLQYCLMMLHLQKIELTSVGTFRDQKRNYNRLTVLQSNI
jgi:hypothetical protein